MPFAPSDIPCGRMAFLRKKAYMERHGCKAVCNENINFTLRLCRMYIDKYLHLGV